MAAPRTETLDDLLPELSATLSDLSMCYESARKEARRQRQQRIREERLARAKLPAHLTRVKHDVDWVDAGKCGSAVGGGSGAEFGPYIRPTPAMLSPTQLVRALAPDRVYERGITPGWFNPSQESHLFYPRVNEHELCPPLPRRYSYLTSKLTQTLPKIKGAKPDGPEPYFPPWVS